MVSKLRMIWKQTVLNSENSNNTNPPMVVNFTEEGSLGVNLVETTVNNTVAVEVESLRLGSQAMRHEPILRRGLIVVGVGGTDVRGQSFDRVVELVQDYPDRPIAIEFVAALKSPQQDSSSLPALPPPLRSSNLTGASSNEFGARTSFDVGGDSALQLAIEAKNDRASKLAGSGASTVVTGTVKKTAAQQEAEASRTLELAKWEAEKKAALKAAAKEDAQRAAAEEAASAALIQARVRGQACRRAHLRKAAAVIMLQRATRGRFAAIAVAKLKQEKALQAAVERAKAEAEAERKRGAKMEARERAAAAKRRRAREASAGTLRVNVVQVSLKTEGAYGVEGWAGYSAPFVQMTVAGVTFQSWLPVAPEKAVNTGDSRRKEVGSQGCFCFAVPGAFPYNP